MSRGNYYYLISVIIFSSLFPNFIFADVSNVSNIDTLSTHFACSSSQSGNYQGYQYLGQGLTGKLSQVDIKQLTPGPTYYGKGATMEIYESDTYLEDFNTITSSQIVWKVGTSLFDSVWISNYDGVISFNNPTIGSNYNFLPSKHYYLVPRFFTIDGGGICQSSYLYGSSDSNSYPFGEYFPDPYIKDIYFYLRGVDRSAVPSGNSNVLFIPGLEASRLYKPNSIIGEDQLWEPARNSDVEALYLNNDGTSINPYVYTRDIIKETNVPISTGLAGQNIYKSFSNMMDHLVSLGTINKWDSYAYDWREGVQNIVDNGTVYSTGQVSLTSTLQNLSDTSQNGKVTIIAHSNGGLIAKALLKKLQDDKAAGRNILIDKVDVLMLVASPQLGTPSAIPAMLHGYDQRVGLGLLMDNLRARELGRNMQGAYGLLPSLEYFNKVRSPVVTFVSNYLDPYLTNEIATYGKNINSYNSMASFLTGSDGRNNPLTYDTLKPIKLNGSQLALANNLHLTIDNLVLPQSIRLIQVAGWGLDTIAGFQYSASTTCQVLSDNGCTGRFILDEKPIFTSDGDKTVVTPSALSMGGEKYWVNLAEHNAELTLLRRNRQHKDILEVDQLNDFVFSTLTKQSIIYDLVFMNSQPMYAKNRLRLSVHSPVTLEAYDIEGNHTGKICLSGNDFCYVEETIPNSSYLEFGEGKYLNIPEDLLQKVTLKGTGFGSFTFDLETVFSDETVTTSSFIDIPVISQTRAEVILNQTTHKPELKLDITGDGVIDLTLNPTSAFDPIAFLQVLKSTLVSLEITRSKKVAFGNAIDSIIKSIQAGKINKSKLNADKFKEIFNSKLLTPDFLKPKPEKLSQIDGQLFLDMLSKLLDNLK